MVNTILEDEPEVNGEKIIKEYLGQTHVGTFALNIADMNNTKIHTPSIKDRRSGANTSIVTNIFYKGAKIKITKGLYYGIIDMYQYLFNLPQVVGRVGGGTINGNSHKNYIKIVKETKNVEASIILEDHPEPIFIKFGAQQFGKGRKSMGSKAGGRELTIKYELINRLIRDIITMYFEMGEKKMPTFWFVNADEVNARFLPQFSDIYQNKIWVREWDYVRKMCAQIDKIIELDSKNQLKCEISGKNKKDGHQLYFNENSIVSAEHRSRGGRGKPSQNLQLIGDVEILQLEDPPEDPYYPIPEELDPNILSKVFGFANSNYISCIFSSNFK